MEAASDLERNASESSSRSLPTECRLCSSIHLSRTDNERAGQSLLRFTKEALSPLHCSQKPAPLTVATVKLFPQAKHRLAMPLISLCIRALSLLHPLLSGSLPSLVSPATLFLRSSTPLSLVGYPYTLSLVSFFVIFQLERSLLAAAILWESIRWKLLRSLHRCVLCTSYCRLASR